MLSEGSWSPHHHVILMYQLSYASYTHDGEMYYMFLENFLFLLQKIIKAYIFLLFYTEEFNLICLTFD